MRDGSSLFATFPPAFPVVKMHPKFFSNFITSAINVKALYKFGVAGEIGGTIFYLPAGVYLDLRTKLALVEGKTYAGSKVVFHNQRLISYDGFEGWS